MRTNGNRTSEWLANVLVLIGQDLAKEVDSTLMATADSYEYEKIALPEESKPLRDVIEEWFAYKYRIPMTSGTKAMIEEKTAGAVKYEMLSERAKKEIDLLDNLYTIEKMASGTQEEVKRVEKVLFDDDGKHFREIFRKIAGGEV